MSPPAAAGYELILYPLRSGKALGTIGGPRLLPSPLRLMGSRVLKHLQPLR